MFNLAEILTLIIGLLLALVFIDGIRRSLRSRASALKVDLINSAETGRSDFEQEWLDGYDEKDNFAISEEASNEILEEFEEIDITHSSSLVRRLLIINLSSGKDNIFSYDSIPSMLRDYPFSFDERGYFSVTDGDDHLLFNILNGKNPGTFLEGTSTSDIAFVFDPLTVLSPVEVFDLMYEISQTISESLNADLLDENRNVLTKQMLVHMRQEAQEFQRQKLAIVS